ncbi:hypothetical protein PIB30_111183, partial [Stylosanthes scabra]|nr:hypothetical protein [Stylosanthes scabra]
TSKNFKFGVGECSSIHTQLALSSSKKIQKRMKTEDELITKSERESEFPFEKSSRDAYYVTSSVVERKNSNQWYFKNKRTKRGSTTKKNIKALSINDWDENENKKNNLKTFSHVICLWCNRSRRGL